MKEFIFVRHGQSQANVESLIADPSSPLTQLGLEQARQTADKLKNLDITMIACSPFLRTRQTAVAIANVLWISTAKIKVAEELRERGLGELDGTKKDQDSAWYFLTDEPRGVELSDKLFDRMSKCLNLLRKLSENEHLLVVGHACSGFYLLQIAAGKRAVRDFDPPLQIENAGFVKVKL